jgi:hypothetical protein
MSPHHDRVHPNKDMGHHSMVHVDIWAQSIVWYIRIIRADGPRQWYGASELYDPDGPTQWYGTCEYMGI